MKKRLRKKKHLAEFKEFGWYVDYQFESVSEEADFAFWDMLIEEVEALGLMIGGSTTSFFAHPASRVPEATTQYRQQQLHQWLTRQLGVGAVTSSPLTDAWYGPFQ
ncbi:uncharacterized protein YggL (DUF469 family) [Hymenobacter luteus]|uniref:Uncharacterized protein YggL (DUF469 family) n=2 Tax=Hymenobacter TaxID=89966 RepID=A0A7W9T2S3_9BACT|nr:50S ribosome-binding protein YggL [Hymenobacter luteus]MBB6060371.1 uncharacterized protein YggL (DUF469 family) [Hymenobacter luteus]